MPHPRPCFGGALLVFLALHAFAPTAHSSVDCQPILDSLATGVNYLALDPWNGSVWGVDQNGNNLVRLEDGGQRAVLVHHFANLIMGIHFTNDGTMFVSTDFDYSSASYPCSLFRSTDAGQSFVLVKEFLTSCPVYWSMAHDRDDNLYVGEYGPRAAGQSKNVWKSTDHGDSWSVVFSAPDLAGTHIHRVAVDPYTGHVWVTHGDTPSGMYCSRDGGETWTFVRASKATGVAFTPQAIYWGEDANDGTVTRYDRATEQSTPVLIVSTLGPYGGTISDMTVGPSGQVYVPFKRFAGQAFLPTVWFGHDTEWHLLKVLVEPSTGASQITPPDPDGYMYFMYHRIAESCPGAAVTSPSGMGELVLRVTPNPGRGSSLRVTFWVPTEAPAVIEVFDVSGRRVVSRRTGPLDAGPHVVDLTEARGRASGLYFVRLTQGARRKAVRVAITT